MSACAGEFHFFEICSEQQSHGPNNGIIFIDYTFYYEFFKHTIKTRCEFCYFAVYLDVQVYVHI